MYEELVKRLREQVKCNKKIYPQGVPFETLMLDLAADAIEELSMFREQISDGHIYCMRDGVLYQLNVEPLKGNVVYLPPIEFAEPPKDGES